MPAGLLLHVFLARELPLTAYGLFALAAALASWLEWSLSGMLARASLSFLGKPGTVGSDIPARLLRRHLAAGVLAGLLLAAAAVPIAALVGMPETTPLLLAFAGGLPFFGVALFFRTALIAWERPRWRSGAIAARWLARLALTWVLVDHGHGALGAVLAASIAWIPEIVVARLAAPVGILRGSTTHGQLRGFWQLAGATAVSSIALRVFDKLDILMVGTLLDDQQATAIYAAAQNFALIPGFFAMAWTATMLRQLQQHRLTPGIFAADAGEILRVLFWLLPFAALAAATGEVWLPAVLGPSYAAASGPFAMLICAACAMAIGSGATVILIARGRHRFFLAAALALPLIAAAAHLWIIPRSGLRGAALVTLGGAIAYALAMLGAVIGDLPKRSLPRLAAAPVGLAIAMTAVLTWTSPHGWLSVAAGFILLLPFVYHSLLADKPSAAATAHDES